MVFRYNYIVQLLLELNVSISVYDRLKDLNTSYGGTLDDCLRPAYLHPDRNHSVFASDSDAYATFAPFLDPLIEQYHKVDQLAHPGPDFGDIDNPGLGDLDPDGQFVIFTTIRVIRNLDSYPFPPTMTPETRRDIELVTKNALSTLKDDLAGKYFHLLGMTKMRQKQLLMEHLLYHDIDPLLRDAHAYDDWPNGRGIYLSRKKDFVVFVNKEDHLEIVSRERGGNLVEVWKRLAKVVKSLEATLTFAHNPRQGYLTFNPFNLGTTMKVSVHIIIPNLSQQENFNTICDNYGLHSKRILVTGRVVHEISNRRRLGITEIETLLQFSKGVEEIIKLEKSLRANP